MSRETQVNSFNNGLNKDLNPLLTPSTVMTDCLNGTIVTYNGNEFALQNDLGNYKFEHGSLKEGFVPVGIKEHANVLYIISYNPISNEVEVGSFPSSKTIFKSEINNDSRSVEIKLEDGFNEYTELSKESQLTLLSDLSEDFKLNPGDMYILERDSGGNYDEDLDELNNIKEWQHTATYIFTENNKLYNIDGFVTYSANRDSYVFEDFENVKWDIPGWFAVKPIINVMDEFNYSIHNIEFNWKEDNTSVSTAEIDIQSIWDTNIYGNISDSLKENIKYLVYKEDDGIEYNEEYIKNIGSNSIKTYNNIYTVIHNTLTITTESKYITIIPVLNVGNKYIVYDQFKTVVSLEKKEWNPDDVTFGTDIFKYYVGKEAVTLSFDLSSPIDSVIKYQLWRYIDKYDHKDITKTRSIKNGDDLYPVYSDYQDLSDIIENGQNVFNINYTIDVESTNYNNDSGVYNHFDKEDFYKIKFYIIPSELSGEDDKSDLENDKLDLENDKRVKIVEKNLYISEYINYYHNLYDNFDCEEFTLNDEAFIESVSRMVEFSNIINDTSESVDIVKIDNEIISDETELKNKINEFHDSIEYYSSNPLIYEQELNIYHGTRYLFDGKFNIVWPKNQHGRIGRFWVETEILNPVIKGIDSNNNYVNFEYNDDKWSFDVLSKATIDISTTQETRLYPESESNTATMYSNSGPVSKIEENGKIKYRFNYGALVWKDDNDKDYSCGTYEPRSSLTYTIDGDTINIEGAKFTYNKSTNNWDGYESQTGIFNNRFKYNYDWGNNLEKASTCSFAVNKKMSYPCYITFFNNKDKGWTKYFRLDSQFNTDYNCGMSNPRFLFSDKWLNHEPNKYFYSIGASGAPDSEEFCIILPGNLEHQSTASIGNNDYEYVFDSFLTYLYMMAYVKWCKNNQSTTYYIPKFVINESKVSGIFIDKLEYHSDIKYTYPTISNDSEILNGLNNIKLHYYKDYDVHFINNGSDDVVFTIEGYNEDRNISNFISAGDALNFNEVFKDTMFVDRRCNSDLKDRLIKLANMFEYKSGRFKIKEINENMSLNIRKRSDDYDHICHLSSEYYEV